MTAQPDRSFFLRFTAFDPETGQQVGEPYDMMEHHHSDIDAARKRLAHVNSFAHRDCFADIESRWVVQSVEIVPVA